MVSKWHRPAENFIQSSILIIGRTLQKIENDKAKEISIYLQSLHVYNPGSISKVNENFDEETHKTTWHLSLNVSQSLQVAAKPTRNETDVILYVTNYLEDLRIAIEISEVHLYIGDHQAVGGPRTSTQGFLTSDGRTRPHLTILKKSPFSSKYTILR